MWSWWPAVYNKFFVHGSFYSLRWRGGWVWDFHLLSGRHSILEVPTTPHTLSKLHFWYKKKHFSQWLKSTEKSHSTLRAKRTTFTFWMGKNWSKMPKWSWSLRQTVSPERSIFNITKIGEKCQNSKNSNAALWWFFKHCDLFIFSAVCLH